jgi:hypothetical protein
MSDASRTPALTDRLVPVVVFAVVLLVAIMTIAPWPVGSFEDDGIYTVLARSLASGDGYRFTNLPGSPNATHYPPGYPFVLSMLWRASPDFPGNVAMMKFANAIFLALAALGTWFFARSRLAMTSRTAGVAAVVSTISIVVLFVTGLVLSEPLFLALLMPALILSERSADTGDLREAALAGALLGALTLVRTLGALAIPAAFVVLLARRKVRAAFVLAGVASIALLPWQVWQNLHAHEVAPVLLGKYGAYGPWMSEGYSSGGLTFAMQVIARNVTGIVGMNGYMFMPLRVEWLRVLAFSIAAGLCIAGAATSVRRMPVSVAFLGVYLLVVLVWPFDANRFLWAIWPLLVLAVWRGVARLWRWGDAGPRIGFLRPVFVALALLPAAGFLVYNVRGYRGAWWASIQKETAQQAAPIVEWVSRYTQPTDVIATERDLVVHLYTGRQATPVSTYRATQRVRPLTAEEDTEALRQILASYSPRFIIVSSEQSMASAELLAGSNPPALRRLGDLTNARVYERIAP